METHRRLLETGRTLFAAQGVGNTRATDIAQKAGVAVGTLYLHFGDKRGLLRAILFAGIEELLAPLHKLPVNPPGEMAASIRAHTRIMVDFAGQHRDLCRVLFDPESQRLDVNPEIMNYLVAMHEKRLIEAMEHGRVPVGLNPRITAHAVVGMLVKVLDAWTRDPSWADRDALVDTVTRLRVSGIQPVPGSA